MFLTNLIQLCTTPVACVIQNRSKNIPIDVSYHLGLINKNGGVKSKIHTFPFPLVSNQTEVPS